MEAQVCLIRINTDAGNIEMRGSRKYPYPHHRGSLEIPRRRGVLKAKIFKVKCESTLEFTEG